MWEKGTIPFLHLRSQAGQSFPSFAQSSHNLRHNIEICAMPVWTCIISPWVTLIFGESQKHGNTKWNPQRNYNGSIVFACVGGFRRHCTLWHPWKIMLAHSVLLKRHKKSYPSHKVSSLPFLSLCYKYSHKYPLDLFYFFSYLKLFWTTDLKLLNFLFIWFDSWTAHRKGSCSAPWEALTEYKTLQSSTATTGLLNSSADSYSSSPWNASWLQFLN